VKKALNKHKKLVFKTLSLKIDSLFYFSIIEHKPSVHSNRVSVEFVKTVYVLGASIQNGYRILFSNCWSMYTYADICLARAMSIDHVSKTFCQVNSCSTLKPFS